MKISHPKLPSFALVVLLALIGLFTTACQRESSETVDQDKIHAKYELLYNANEDKTYARVTFRFSNSLGTKLELESPAEVSFNGDLLNWNSSLAYYEKTYTGFVDSGSFMYVDLDNSNFQNQVSIRSIDFPVGLDSISRSGAYELVWQGDVLAPGDDVNLTINGALEGDSQVFYTNSAGAGSIVLGQDKLSQLGQGSSTIWMRRRAYPGLQQGTSAGGSVVGSYRSVNATPYLK